MGTLEDRPITQPQKWVLVLARTYMAWVMVSLLFLPPLCLRVCCLKFKYLISHFVYYLCVAWLNILSCGQFAITLFLCFFYSSNFFTLEFNLMRHLNISSNYPSQTAAWILSSSCIQKSVQESWNSCLFLFIRTISWRGDILPNILSFYTTTIRTVVFKNNYLLNSVDVCSPCLLSVTSIHERCTILSGVQSWWYLWTQMVWSDVTSFPGSCGV